MRAWIIYALHGDDGVCVVRFGETEGQAKSAGLSELREFGEADEFFDLAARRFPAMDGREHNPPTLRELIESHGWSTQCPECERPIDADGVDRHYYEVDDGPEFERVVWRGEVARCVSCVGDAESPACAGEGEGRGS